MKRLVRAGLAFGIVALALAGATGTATAGETGTIYGRKACEDVADMYKDMGYTGVRCNHIHGDKYYVRYNEPRSSKPSTGSFG